MIAMTRFLLSKKKLSVNFQIHVTQITSMNLFLLFFLNRIKSRMHLLLHKLYYLLSWKRKLNLIKLYNIKVNKLSLSVKTFPNLFLKIITYVRGTSKFFIRCQYRKIYL